MSKWAYVVGIVVGTAALLTSCFVWFSKQVFGVGGTVLSLMGLVLIGMSVWASVKIKLPGGFEAELDKLAARVEDVADANRVLAEDVPKIAEVADATRAGLRDLTQTLEKTRSPSPADLSAIRERVPATWTIDRKRLDSVVNMLDRGPRE